MRMRKKKNLEPRMEACAALWIKSPREYKGKWSSLKPDRKLVRLELAQLVREQLVQTAQCRSS